MYAIESRATQPDDTGIYLIGPKEEQHLLERFLLLAAAGATAIGDITMPEAEEIVMYFTNGRRVLGHDETSGFDRVSIPSTIKRPMARLLGDYRPRHYLDARRSQISMQFIQGHLSLAQLREERDSLREFDANTETVHCLTNEGWAVDNTILKSEGLFVPDISFPTGCTQAVAEEAGATHVVTQYEILPSRTVLRDDGGGTTFSSPEISDGRIRTLVGTMDNDTFVPVTTLLGWVPAEPDAPRYR